MCLEHLTRGPMGSRSTIEVEQKYNARRTRLGYFANWSVNGCVYRRQVPLECADRDPQDCSIVQTSDLEDGRPTSNQCNRNTYLGATHKSRKERSKYQTSFFSVSNLFHRLETKHLSKWYSLLRILSLHEVRRNEQQLSVNGAKFEIRYGQQYEWNDWIVLTFA